MLAASCPPASVVPSVSTKQVGPSLHRVFLTVPQGSYLSDRRMFPDSIHTVDEWFPFLVFSRIQNSAPFRHLLLVLLR